ncbi:MAG: UDP-N-acetylmuramate dehydrogenase [Bacteroidota bacterium]
MEIYHDVDLQPYNTFGISVRARQFARIHSQDDVRELLASGHLHAAPRLVLGGGSNVLLTRDFPGLVLSIAVTGRRIVSEDAEQLVLEVGAGENWHDLVWHCVDQGWGGIENLSLIPGLMGAAPIQNIGAYGVELKDVFAYLDAMFVETGEVQRFHRDDCRFGYRDSVFKRELKGKVVILRVALHLRKTPHQLVTHYGAVATELEKAGKTAPTIRDVSEAVIGIRQSKLPDPAVIGNAGSFFKNPIIDTAKFAALKEKYPDLPGYPAPEGYTKLPAAWLIDRAQWKGKRFGNYGVHDRQALVLVNHGGASGQDIYDLSSRILESVREVYGVELEREVNII